MNKAIKVEAKIANYDSVRNLLIELLENNDVPLPIIMKFEIVLEELFVNICNYAYEETGLIEVDCSIKDNRIYLTIKDSGQTFNPFQRANPDINAPIEERPIGGLGIFLVKKNADSFDYKNENNMNIVDLTFNLI